MDKKGRMKKESRRMSRCEKIILLCSLCLFIVVPLLMFILIFISSNYHKIEHKCYVLWGTEQKEEKRIFLGIGETYLTNMHVYLDKYCRPYRGNFYVSNGGVIESVEETFNPTLRCKKGDTIIVKSYTLFGKTKRYAEGVIPVENSKSPLSP